MPDDDERETPKLDHLLQGSQPDTYIKTIDRPVAVHLFNNRTVIVGHDGTVLTVARR